MLCKLSVIFSIGLLFSCGNDKTIIEKDGVKIVMEHTNDSSSNIFVYAIESDVLRSKGLLVNGKMEGEFIYYDPTGAILRKESFFNDKLSGIYIEYFSNENVSYIGSYIDGLKSNVWVKYFRSGLVQSKEIFSSGKLHGTFVEYHKNGKLKMDSEFIQGKPTYYTEYDSLGSVIDEYRVVKIVIDHNYQTDTVLVNENVDITCFVSGEKKWKSSQFAINLSKIGGKEVTAELNTCSNTSDTLIISHRFLSVGEKN